VDVLTPAETRNTRAVFFRSIFGVNNGYFCLSHMQPGKHSTWRDEFFVYPQEQKEILDRIEILEEGHNVYFCPMLFSEKMRKKEFVSVTPVAWSDLDFCDPSSVDIPPSVTIESSPDRYQAYWVMDSPLDPDDMENLSRRIAYKHAAQGADRSGWDLTQALRVPLTFNYKHDDGVSFPTVKVLEINKRLYRMADFEDDYPEVAGYIYVVDPLPDLVGMPAAEDILEARRLELNPTIWRLFNEMPEGDWSAPLWNLQMLLFETGFTREQVFVVIQEAKCNKYRRDGKPLDLLWKEVCRAFARNQNNEVLLKKGIVDEVQEPLLSPAEREIILHSEDTFIERYMAWARALGDAAPQYHQAGAFVALSSLLAGRVRLPTSFGNIIPNLWFMILADTTLTRKTTAMDIAMDMITEIDSDCLLATDGSIEGLLGSLSTRPGRPSVFLRDEFSGLLEQMTKKDYMAGMPELLTKLYDGKMQKRILRKETIEVRDPVLIFFAGGIKSKITSILTTEQVSSGFMPRFIFITAESDISRLKPIGPPTAVTINNGEAIRNELQEMYSHYNKTVSMTIANLKAKVEEPKHFSARLTDDAWVRYNELEYQMLQSGLKAEHPDIMTPTYDRLSKSILKAATLLAASEQRDQEVVVDLSHLLRAIYYGEQWRTFVDEVMSQIGLGQAERQLEGIVRSIERKPGITRSQIMQWHHLTAYETTRIFETLEQRGSIIRKQTGRTEQLFPIK
jgi:hypothetical protein